MNSQHLLDTVAEKVLAGDIDGAAKAAKAAAEAGVQPMAIMQDGVARGMDKMNELFNELKAFIPELMLAGEAAKACMDVVKPFMKSDAADIFVSGTIVIGTVEGDVHDIGKNLVCTVLTASGFNVIDLGIDVKAKEFVQKAKEFNADFIAMSSLLTNSLPYQKDVIEYLKDTGIREKYYVIVGGGPVTPDFAEEIGADGYARLATEAVELCRKLATKKIAPATETQIYGRIC